MMQRTFMLRGACIALLLSYGVAWGQSSTSADAGAAAAARCHARRASVDACDDAIRYNPHDTSLLVAMGDAQMRARRPGDALRAYQRAAALTPGTAGIQLKINKAQAILARSKNSAGRAAVTASNAPKRFTNADPETQSH